MKLPIVWFCVRGRGRLIDDTQLLIAPRKTTTNSVVYCIYITVVPGKAVFGPRIALLYESEVLPTPVRGHTLLGERRLLRKRTRRKSTS